MSNAVRRASPSHRWRTHSDRRHSLAVTPGKWARPLSRWDDILPPPPPGRTIPGSIRTPSYPRPPAFACRRSNRWEIALPAASMPSRQGSLAPGDSDTRRRPDARALGHRVRAGQCKGRPAEHTPACDTTPAKAPFESTGWKTVAMDHFTMDAVDYKKEAAYYAALMNWKIRSDDGKQAVLDIGDIATVVIRGGYTPPPRRRPRSRRPATRPPVDVAAVAAARALRPRPCGA